MVRNFYLIDVFGRARLEGNPLAVVTQADDLTTEQMQAITRWLNLSETTFLLPPTDPQADYRVRIFTLDRELPFAGHPTLGTCHAWLAEGGVPRGDHVIQQCASGLVPISREAGSLAFAAPPQIRSGPVGEAELVEAIGVLGIGRDAVIEAQWIDNGPGWLGILLASAEEVLALRPVGAHPVPVHIGVVGRHAEGGPVGWEVRAILSDHHRRLIEDPVTGSLNASVAQWLIESGRAGPSYVAAQGTSVGRCGRVAVARDGEGRIWIGGRTETLFTGRTCF